MVLRRLQISYAARSQYLFPIGLTCKMIFIIDMCMKHILIHFVGPWFLRQMDDRPFPMFILIPIVSIHWLPWLAIMIEFVSPLIRHFAILLPVVVFAHYFLEVKIASIGWKCGELLKYFMDMIWHLSFSCWIITGGMQDYEFNKEDIIINNIEGHHGEVQSTGYSSILLKKCRQDHYTREGEGFCWGI